MGGGGKGGPKGPSPQDIAKAEFSQAKGYWENYGKWRGEAQTSYERELADLRARAGASGGGPQSELLAQLEAERTGKYEQELKGLQSGEHGSFLTSYFQKTQKELVSSAQQREAFQAQTSQGNAFGKGGTALTPDQAMASGENTGTTVAAFPPVLSILLGSRSYNAQQFGGTFSGMSSADLQKMSMEDFYARAFGDKSVQETPEQRAEREARVAGGGAARRETGRTAGGGAAGANLIRSDEKLGSTGWW